MVNYILVVASIIIFSFLFEHTKLLERNGRPLFKNKKLVLCVLLGVILFLGMTIKSPEIVGTDLTAIYKNNFDRVQELEWGQMLEEYRDTEVLFYVFTKLFTIFSTNYELYLTICSLPLIIAISFLIYKKSENVGLSFLVFVGLHYYGWCFIVVRHSIALAFVIFSFYFLSEKKMGKTLLFFILAVLFHRTALLFGIAIVLKCIRYHKIFFAASLGIGMICFLFRDIVFLQIFSIFSSGHFLAYVNKRSMLGWGVPTTMYYVVSGIACILYGKNLIRKNGKLKLLSIKTPETKQAKSSKKIAKASSEDSARSRKFNPAALPEIARGWLKRGEEGESAGLDNLGMNVATLGCLINSMMSILVEFLRMGMFFTFPIIYLYPNSLKQIKEKRIYAAVYGVSVMFLILFGRTVFDSLGLWQFLL